jgi:hypothetical protein
VVGGSFEKELLYCGKIGCLTTTRSLVRMCLIVWSSLSVLIMIDGVGGAGPGAIITTLAPRRPLASIARVSTWRVALCCGPYGRFTH